MYQPTPQPSHPVEPPVADPAERRAFQEYMMTERQALIMRLAKVDSYLLAAGLIVEPTVKTRQERRAERRHDEG